MADLSVKFGTLDLDDYAGDWQGSARRRVVEQVIPRRDGVRVDLGPMSGYEVSLLGGLEVHAPDGPADLRALVQALKQGLMDQGKAKLRTFDDRYRLAQLADFIESYRGGRGMLSCDFEARFLAELPFEIADAVSSKQEAITEVLSEKQETVSGSQIGLRFNAAHTYMKQGFQLDGSGVWHLVKTELRCQRYNNPSGDVWVEVWGDTSGVPDPSSVISGASNAVKVDASTIGTSVAWVEFGFTSPVSLAKGTPYHLVLAGDYAISTTHRVGFDQNDAGGYRTDADPFDYGKSSDGSSWAVTTSVDLVFRLYKGPEGAEAQAFTATTGGTAPAPPVVSIDADVTALADAVLLTNLTQGAFFAYHGTLASGKTLVVDCEKQTAEVDGVSVLSDFEGDFFFLAAGANNLTFAGDPCTVTLQWYDRWW